MTDSLLRDLEDLFYAEPRSRMELKPQYERLKRALHSLSSLERKGKFVERLTRATKPRGRGR